MNELSYELESLPERKARSAASLFTNKRFVKIAVVAVWVLLGAAAFTIATLYIADIQKQLTAIQTTNEANTAALHEKISELQSALQTNIAQAETLQTQFEAVEAELSAVKEEMSLAGDSLSTTAETKQALSERISALGKQLEELRKAIKKLEEAARVY